jgi:hypothetical protein
MLPSVAGFFQINYVIGEISMRQNWFLWAFFLLAAGCGGESYSTQSISIDTTKPGVVYTAPANRDTGVGTNITISVTFSKPMDPATIRTNTFTLSAPDGSAVSASLIGYDAANSIAQFNPATNLSPTTIYTATIDKGVADQMGNAMGANYSWSFMTGPSSDTTAPTVTSHSPQGTDVAVTSKIAAVLSKPMDPSTFNVSTFTLKAGNSGVPGSVSFVGTTAVFTPASSLAPITTYTATITTDAKDLAGNGMSTSYSWTFATSNSSTPDTVAPKVVSTTPVNQAVAVSVKTTLSVVYDKPIYPYLPGSVDGVAAKTEIIYHPDHTSEARMIPTQDLKRGSHYTARISTKDLSGNQMPTYSWEFITER